jgi:hypothetical protein
MSTFVKPPAPANYCLKAIGDNESSGIGQNGEWMVELPSRPAGMNESFRGGLSSFENHFQLTDGKVGP